MENRFPNRKDRAMVSFLPPGSYIMFLERPVCISSLAALEREGIPQLVPVPHLDSHT